MTTHDGWSTLELEARTAFLGAGRFPIRAYSEFMPPPYIGIKPYAPDRTSMAATAIASDEASLDISEYELSQEISPGLHRIAAHVMAELSRLLRGDVHVLSRSLLSQNPAWSRALSEAARQHAFRDDPLSIVLPLALSRTQDDKGNVRWTLFGTSHDGAGPPFWRSFGDQDGERFEQLAAWATGGAGQPSGGLRILDDGAQLPAFARRLRLAQDEPLEAVETLFTLVPFARLPERVRDAYLGRALRIIPNPASLVFFEHPHYQELARLLPRATQIPLLHLFPRAEGGHAIRIPQSGWIDERPGSRHDPHGHRMVAQVERRHRWQRMHRDEEQGGDAFTSKVSVALFSTDPDHLGLYGKPMGRNVQIWNESYELVLDGPLATRPDLDRARRTVAQGGRFGYRLYFPPMRAGTRELFWHLPLVARLDTGGQPLVYDQEAPLGYVTAEPTDGTRSQERLTLGARPLSRPGHQHAASLFPRDPGHARWTTSNNIRKLLEFRDYLGGPLPPSFARRLVHIAKDGGLEPWLRGLPALASDRDAGEGLLPLLLGCIGPEAPPLAPLTFPQTATREFEERLWRTIAFLSEGPFRLKDNADAILANEGKTGGLAAQAARVHLKHHRDLEKLGDHLHDRYRELIAAHGMQGRAVVADQVFQWRTDFDFDWSQGWARNQRGQGRERNVVVMIPGACRDEAVILADHYDTAYMEDAFEAARGGDGLRAAAAGADDNHSATTALLLAAEVLLPLAREGKLARDVWLVHLTGEEFPSDCLGARALAQALIERNLVLTAEDGSSIDCCRVHAEGVVVMDMIAHNSGHGRDVFQIAPGEGAASAWLALRIHLANERWNEGVRAWNRQPERHGKGRALRQDTGAQPPPPFAHLALAGEIRTEWEPRSSLYNTDGQIFSDVGIPVVLLMENYDINRSGYHDTHDTMKNIDLDYAAALTAIAIEAAADLATQPGAAKE
jgi:hypothetical protein